MSDHMKIDWTVVDLRARIATLEAQLAEWVDASIAAAAEYCWQRYKGREPMNLASPAVFTSHEHQKIEEYIRYRLSVLEAAPPAPKVTECATEGCAQTATVRFERGGVGSDYCRDCYMRIQSLTAAQEAGKP